MIPLLQEKNRFVELDALRGIAASLVVLYHYTTRYEELFLINPISFFSLPWGKYGVQLFFIISGFVIFMTIEKTKNPLDFIVNRFARLFPVYWAAVIVTFGVVSVSFLPLQLKTTFLEALINLSMLQYFVGIKDVDGAYWSLAFELVFYFLIFTAYVTKKLKHIEYIGYVWLELMLLYYFGIIPQRFFLGTILLMRYANLFFAGILFYQLKTKGSTPFRHLALLGCLVTQLIIAPIEESITVAVCFVVFYLFIYDRLKILNKRPLLFLGAISYPLYLSHEYLGYIFIGLLTRFVTSPLIIFTLAISFAIALASLLHFLVEEPSRKAIRNWRARVIDRPRSSRIKPNEK